MTSPAVERVSVADHERIVPHGAARATWFVRKGEAWVKAAEWEGVSSTRRDAGPGTVWERTLDLELPIGTELMRVETRPRAVPVRDPLSYLTSETKRPPRATRRTYYRVERGGRLRSMDGRQ